jgi:hypothetical protein
MTSSAGAERRGRWVVVLFSVSAARRFGWSVALVYGFAGGTVGARLVEQHGRTRIELRGSWVCSAEPVANGPS